MGNGISKLVLDNASEGIILCDCKFNCIYVNKFITALTGTCIDANPNKPIEHILPLLNLDSLLEHFYAAAAGKETKCEISFIRKSDSSKIWVYARIMPIQYNNCNYVVAYLSDISKQKQSDTAERRRQQEMMRLLSAAIRVAGNAIIITNNQGEIVWANQAFTQLTGYELEEVKGKKPSILKSGKHNQEFYSELWDTINSGKVWQGEIVNRHKDGILYFEDMTITPVFDETGNITHFIAIKSDITKKKEMEQELRFLYKRFELIFNSSPAGIAIVALRDFRFIEVNASFLETTKYKREEIVGFSAKELDLFEKADDFIQKLQDISTSSAHHNYDLNIKTKDRRIRNVLVSSEKVKLGIEDCVVLILNDITEKKLLEEQLLHSQKLESIGTLSGGVAHDFNNILTVIQGHSNLLMMSPSLPPELQDSVRQIAEAAERAAGLTRQLLGFSRKQRLEPRLLNINSVIENLTKMLKRLIGENIVLECSYQPDLPLVLADIGMMEQILMNLVVNARDAMPKGGRLTITTSSKFISANKFPNSDISEGEYVIISIKDTGQGIKPKHLPKIFDPFFTTKEAGKGTGLGLATVHNIVNQHKGWIEVKSTLNVGTEFIIYLPAAPKKEDKSPDEPYLWAKGRGETILFVEDDDKIREMTKTLLEQCGYNVLQAQDAITGLQLWRENKDKISLLFTDMILPRGITGRQLAEQLSNEKPNLKVILAITYTPELAQIEFAEFKKWLFLQKPYMPSAVVNMVRQSLDIKNNHTA